MLLQKCLQQAQLSGLATLLLTLLSQLEGMHAILCVTESHAAQTRNSCRTCRVLVTSAKVLNLHDLVMQHA